MAGRLEGKRIAILAAEGFEQVQLMRPREALDAEGAETILISPLIGKIRAWNGRDWGEEVNVDLALDSAHAADFDALLVPGGIMNADKLRVIPEAVRFVQQFFRAHKPVAAISHGPWLLVEADALRSRTITSCPSLETDIRNAGGEWVDEDVVNDQGLVTSRQPSDIPAFNQKFIEEIAVGPHAKQQLHRATA